MKRNFGPLFLFLAALFWSICGLMTKSIHWSGFYVAVGRGVISFFLFLLILRKLPLHPSKYTLLNAVCFFAQGLLFVMANKYTTAANATVLQNTSAVYIILFTALSAKRLPRREDIFTCAILFCGILLTMLGSLGGGGTVGNLLSMVSALFYAGVFFCSRKDPDGSMDAMLLGNGLNLLLLPFMLLDPQVRASTGSDLLYIGILGVSLTAAWFCFSKGIRTTPALQANFITMAEPVMAPIWTLVLLHETVTVYSLIGCVIVIGTILIYNFRTVRAASSAASEEGQP